MSRRDEPYSPPRGAAAHFCNAVGSTIYCPLTDCGYCDGGAE